MLDLRPIASMKDEIPYTAPLPLTCDASSKESYFFGNMCIYFNKYSFRERFTCYWPLVTQVVAQHGPLALVLFSVANTAASPHVLYGQSAGVHIDVKDASSLVLWCVVAAAAPSHWKIFNLHQPSRRPVFT